MLHHVRTLDYNRLKVHQFHINSANYWWNFSFAQKDLFKGEDRTLEGILSGIKPPRHAGELYTLRSKKVHIWVPL